MMGVAVLNPSYELVVRRHLGVIVSVQEKPMAYACVFCNDAIEPGPLDPCALQLTSCVDRPRSQQKEQTFFCHIHCLQSRAAIHQGNFYIADPDFPTVGG
jgi:hypothetical protein